MSESTGWFYWAALSAVFAALTAIFAKIGLEGVDSDLATLVRTVIIVVVLGAFVWLTREVGHFPRISVLQPGGKPIGARRRPGRRKTEQVKTSGQGFRAELRLRQHVRRRPSRPLKASFALNASW